MKRLSFLLGLTVLIMFSACKKEETHEIDDSNKKPIDRGNIEVSSFYITFQEVKPGALIDTFFYSTANPQYSDTIRLINTKSYASTLHFQDKNGNEVNSDIQNSEIHYVVCYHPDDPTDLRLNKASKDKNEDNFGLTSKWITHGLTQANEHHYLNILFRYLPLKKENTCSAGVLLLNANMLYVIK